MLSQALAVGSTVAVSFAVDSGFGKRTASLSASNIEAIQRKIYAATILYVLTVGAAKLSAAAFFARLMCTAFHKVAVIVVVIIVICWTLATASVVAFGCRLPRPWEIWGGTCISMVCFLRPQHNRVVIAD